MPLYSNFASYSSDTNESYRNGKTGKTGKTGKNQTCGGASKRSCDTNYECLRLQDESNAKFEERTFAVKRYIQPIKLDLPHDSIISERYKKNSQGTNGIDYTKMFKDDIKKYTEKKNDEIHPQISDIIEKRGFLYGLKNTNVKDVNFNSDQKVVNYVMEKMLFNNTYFDISDNIAKDKTMFNNPTRAVNQIDE